MERVALPGKAEGGIPGDRKFGVRVSFFNGSNFVNSVYESFNPDCGSDWQYVSAAAVALGTYSCKILNVGGSLASTLGIQNPFRYRGYVYDQETGLYYLQTRYYDPELGRFISADDLSCLGAGGELLGCNLFAYCGNNPVNRTDPDGTDWQDVFAVGIIVAAAGLIILATISTGGGALVFAGAGGTVAAATSAVAAEVGSAMVCTGTAVAVESLAVYYAKDSKKSSKERTTDKPNWANRESVDPNLSAQQNATEMLDSKYGAGNWKKGPGTEFNKIVKWITRAIQ